MDFENKILPFTLMSFEESSSLCLYANHKYKNNIFKLRKNDGFKGNGYDWELFAKVVLNERLVEYNDVIKFDSEGGMFCAYSTNLKALEEFAIILKDICENENIMKDIFTRVPKPEKIKPLSFAEILERINRKEE